MKGYEIKRDLYENLCCLESLSQNFTPKCVRTLDRGFDTNDYYRYFLKRGERFVIRAKKGMSFMADRPVTSWMLHYNIKVHTAWILKIKAVRVSSLFSMPSDMHWNGCCP